MRKKSLVVHTNYHGHVSWESYMNVSPSRFFRVRNRHGRHARPNRLNKYQQTGRAAIKVHVNYYHYP